MRKLLLVLLVFIPFTFLKAQDSIKIPLNDTGKITVSKVYNDAKSALTGLAQALKVGSEHVYEVLVKQQIVYSITYTILDLILIIVIALCWNKFSANNNRLSNKDDGWYNDDLDDHFGLGGLLAISIIISVFTIIVFLCTIQGIVSGFVNPEYGAMKDIVSFFK